MSALLATTKQRRHDDSRTKSDDAEILPRSPSSARKIGSPPSLFRKVMRSKPPGGSSMSANGMTSCLQWELWVESTGPGHGCLIRHNGQRG